MAIIMHGVTSSQVKEIGHDPKTKTPWPFA